jgi:chemotaxis protein MotB
MKKTLIGILPVVVIMIFLSSCVTMKKYQELESEQNKCSSETATLKKQNIDLASKVDELQSKLTLITAQNKQMAKDTARLGTVLRDLTDKYNQLNKSYDDLNQLLQTNSKNSSAEMQKLLADLQKTQDDLQKKEDQLRKTEGDLNTRKAELDELSKQLADKEQKVNELQAILDKKDSVVKALKNKVLDALTGFVNNGLTVEQKNGKVYVHMDEKLLFATGSFDVAPKGAEALKKLAKVLEANTDIRIMIEGHTDDVPYVGSSGPINNNWDLSVMRATAVVKILLKNSSIDPSRLVAAGRSQYMPVDAGKTPEAKAKNRRTEIILTPKLDELFKITEDN